MEYVRLPWDRLANLCWVGIRKRFIVSLASSKQNSLLYFCRFISSNGWFHNKITLLQINESDALPQADAEVLHIILKRHLPSNFQLRRQTPVSTRSVSLGRGAAHLSAQSVHLLDYNENQKTLNNDLSKLLVIWLKFTLTNKKTL